MNNQRTYFSLKNNLNPENIINKAEPINIHRYIILISQQFLYMNSFHKQVSPSTLSTLNESFMPFFLQISSPRPLTQGSSLQHLEKEWESKVGIFGLKSYQWSDLQNLKYYHFLLKLKQNDEFGHQKGKISKINIKISKQVRSRTPAQCRSHNQKMLKRHGSFNAIIDHFSSYFSKKGGFREPAEPTTSSEQLKEGLERFIFREQISESHVNMMIISDWHLDSHLHFNLSSQYPYF